MSNRSYAVNFDNVPHCSTNDEVCARVCVLFIGIIPVMWVELVISVIMIGLGVCLIIGINHVRYCLFPYVMKW